MKQAHSAFNELGGVAVGSYASLLPEKVCVNCTFDVEVPALVRTRGFGALIRLSFSLFCRHFEATMAQHKAPKRHA